jgi:hypothetical protein
MSQSLYVRDGNGDLKQLEVISGSSSATIVPVHSLTGSIATSLSSADLASLTGSMLAVSGAVGTFNQQLYQALSGGPVSMSVDIVAGDVNTITGSVDKVTAEVAKLTALSSSEGLKVSGTLNTTVANTLGTNPLYVSSSAQYPVITALSGVTLINGSVPVTGTLGVDVVIGDQIGISSSLTSPVYVSGTVAVSNFPATQSVGNVVGSPLYITASYALPVNLNGTTVTTGTDYASLVVSGSSTYTVAQTAVYIDSGLNTGSAKTLVIANQTNNMLYLKFDSMVTTASYNYAIDPYATYEAISANARLKHSYIVHPSATSGLVSWTYTK